MNRIHGCTLVTALLMASAASAFAGDTESDALSAYLAKRQVVASQDLAGEISTSGRTSCYIAFVNGTARLDPQSKAQVREIAYLLKEDPELKIEIAFHSSDLGTQGSARKMAHERAVALANALLVMDVPRGRVVAKSAEDPVSVAFNDVFSRN
ncbi:MAG TPA: OmpA family protein [Nevskiaceae bacterium]|nr:OmpA family protein [Nevskiaceae bacterium]